MLADYPEDAFLLGPGHSLACSPRRVKREPTGPFVLHGTDLGQEPSLVVSEMAFSFVPFNSCRLAARSPRGPV